MSQVQLTIDNTPVVVQLGKTILKAAQSVDVYVPSLCAHPNLPPIENIKGSQFIFRGNERIESDNSEATWDGCGICAVEVNGELIRACVTEVANGMIVITGSEKVLTYRREKLFNILERHPHACLTCAQAEGCSGTQCSENVPEEERCCELLGSCELQRISQFVGMPENLPKYRSGGLPLFTDEPLFNFNFELCIGCLRCVRGCQDLRGVETLSFVLKDGRPHVGTSEGPTRSECHCRFCGACVEICPTGALMDKVRAVGKERHKILVPCRNACPAGIDIPLYVRYIAKGETAKAIGIIREKLPFVFSLSWVCFHPCEEECRRAEINSPVSICRLKRFAAEDDTFEWRKRQKKMPATGKKVAVIGSGPAGLTAAYYLAKKGHKVTVFETLAEPGGMLRVGIPEYRLPPEFLRRDIEEIKSIGVSIKCNSLVNKSDLEKFVSEYDAVFIATGAHKAKKIELPGSELSGVYWGVEFLRERALGYISSDSFKDMCVVVVGGGDVAIDSARVALRLGAKDIDIVCLESPEELPALEWEVKEAEEESIRFNYSYGPMEIKHKDGQVKSIKLKACTRVYDEKGRFSPTYDETQTLELPADTIILAIGQDPSSDAFADLGLRSSGIIEIDKKTLATKMEKVYAGGDVTSGPASVIDAIAMGRQAAIEIDKTIGGDGDIDEQLVMRQPVEHYLGNVENFAGLGRRSPVIMNPEERSTSFCAIEETFNNKDARAEASRCLACDLRLEIEAVTLPPSVESIFELVQEVIDGLPEVEGVYQLIDEDKKVIAIKGVINLKAALTEVLEENEKVHFFVFEREPMYTKRESELIQQYLQEYGELPGGGEDDLDDLF